MNVKVFQLKEEVLIGEAGTGVFVFWLSRSWEKGTGSFIPFFFGRPFFPISIFLPMAFSICKGVRVRP